MSTIRADNVAPSAGGTSRSLVRGTAAAWVNFNGTGVIATRDSENVASLVDNGTGNYTVNVTNALADANYSIGMSGYSNAGVTYNCHQMLWGTNIFTTSYQVQMFYAALGSYDTDYVMNQVFGDLA